MNVGTKTIKLKFGAYKHCLWNASCKNLIKEQPDRFALLEGKKCETGTMYFCNTYLEAIFVMELCDGVGLYSDEYEEQGDPGYVVCSKNKWSGK